MFSRLTSTDQLGTPLDSDWQEQVVNLLNDVYLKEREQFLKNFKVFGYHYESEVVFLASFMNENSPQEAPITCALSAELKKQERDQFLKIIVDGFGMLFDDIFYKLQNGQSDTDIYFNDWRPIKIKENEVFYKVTRENVELSIQASELISQNPE